MKNFLKTFLFLCLTQSANATTDLSFVPRSTYDYTSHPSIEKPVQFPKKQTLPTHANETITLSIRAPEKNVRPHVKKQILTPSQPLPRPLKTTPNEVLFQKIITPSIKVSPKKPTIQKHPKKNIVTKIKNKLRIGKKLAHTFLQKKFHIQNFKQNKIQKIQKQIPQSHQLRNFSLDSVIEYEQTPSKNSKKEFHEYFNSFSPEQNMTYHNKYILFSGKIISPINHLYINGSLAPIKKNNQFSQIVELNEKHTINIIPIFLQLSDGQSLTFNIKVFYSPIKKEVKKSQKKASNPSIEFKILSAISKAYHPYGWTETKWSCSPSLEEEIGSKLFNKIKNNNICLTHDKKIVVAFPLTKLYEPINVLSDRIYKDITEQYSNNSTVTLIWFNAKGEYWEMYYPPAKTKHRTSAFMWILNNKEIDPTQLTSADLRHIIQFLKYGL